jgi:arylamine N-acetyltransferase
MPTEPPHTYNLDAYAKRLGLTDVPQPTLEGLSAIAHATSTHPTSNFKMNSMASIARPDGQKATYFNGVFAVRRSGETLEEKTMNSNEETIELLRTEFGLELPDGAVVWPPTR